MVNTATNQEREMRVAVERVVGFAQEFGEAHLNLACHAAFPLSLTPDLLYQIWANFVPEAPWTAVARVLLSRLCKQVGSEMYEMDNAVRNLLLRELKVQFGQKRFESLGEFLLEYVGQRLTEDDPDTQDLRQAQQWTALAYTKPEQAARELAQVLSDRVQQEDVGEVLRLSSLVETLSEPLVEAGFEPLLVYAQGCFFHSIKSKGKSQKLISQLPPNPYIEGVWLFNFQKNSQKSQERSNKVEALIDRVKTYLCEKVQVIYDRIYLLGDLTIDLDISYFDVYFLKNVHNKSYSSIQEFNKRVDFGDYDRLGLGERISRISGLEAVKQSSRLLVLGKPGSGKSTFLHFLAVACCKKELFPDYIPVLIKFRDIKDGNQFDLLDYIHKEFSFGKIKNTKQILDYGKALILLDGLDELSNESQQVIQEHLIWFSQQYYNNYFIITCRTSAIQYAWFNFDCVEIADINQQQVEIYAEKIFTALAGTEQKGKEIKEIFIKVIKKPENQQVAELSLNLILLNLICLVFFNSRFSLSNLSQIFEEGINLILSKWDESKRILRDEIYKNLTVNKKKQLLSYIAAINFKQGDYFVEKNKLIKNISDYLVNVLDDKTDSEMLYMNSEAILRAIECQHGLLVERHRGIYSFYHLVFQEYLTAKYIVKNNISIREFQNGVNLNNKDRWINIESLIKEIKSDISS